MKRKMKLTALLLVAAIICSSVSAFASTVNSSEKTVLEDGKYMIRQDEKTVNLYVNALNQVKSGTRINMWSITRDQTQLFQLNRQDDGSYKISLMKSSMTLNVRARKAGTEIIAYKDTVKNTEYYIIEETERSGYYTIRLKSKPSLALTATGGKGLTLKKYAEGNASQTFCFEKAEKKAYDISLDVPKLSTQDKRWKNYYYDTGATIGRYGCLLVSAAMAMSCMDQKEYRPDQLAEKFRFDNGGYMQWDSGWGKTRFQPGVKYSLSAIRSELEDGKPVIIHGYSSESGHHYAVITGVKGSGTKRSEFALNDPSYGSKIKTLDQFLKKFPSKTSLVLIKK